MAACGGPCGCESFREHLAGVRFQPSATPSRGGGAHALRTNETEKRWHRDHDAYRRLRADGVQPEHVDGSARLEQEAA